MVERSFDGTVGWGSEPCVWCTGQSVDKEKKMDEDDRCEQIDAHCYGFGRGRSLMSSTAIEIGAS